jgi:hypothetical protein
MDTVKPEKRETCGIREGARAVSGVEVGVYRSPTIMIPFYLSFFSQTCQTTKTLLLACENSICNKSRRPTPTELVHNTVAQ